MNKLACLALVLFSSNAFANNLSAEQKWFQDKDRPWLLTISSMKEIPGIGIAEFKTKEDCEKSVTILELVGDSAADLRESRTRDLAGTCWRKGDSRRGQSWNVHGY